MTKYLFLLLIVAISPNKQTRDDLFQSGDLIFQTSLSEQSKAIQLATDSKYSHCGIIFREQGGIFVFEAIQPVKKTPLNAWISRGKDGHFVVKRLKEANRVLTPPTLKKMKEIASDFEGKDYDATFEWNDDKIYCSEFIWKVYERATHLKIGNLERLGDFDLSSKQVKTKLAERYGDQVPLNEIVISPKAIFESELLETVVEN